MLPLERERGALRVVLVVGAGVTSRRHDAAEPAPQRRKPGQGALPRGCQRDSGMPDWDYKDRPDAFCNVPLEEVTGRVGALIEQYRPQVVVSYDPEGPYQHPDHVHAARAAAAAAKATGIPAKFYLTAMRASD